MGLYTGDSCSVLIHAGVATAISLSAILSSSGLDHDWGVELYGELLEIGGGKERMTKYFKVNNKHAERPL